MPGNPTEAIDFVHDALAGRVVFGCGTSRTAPADELERAGARRVMLIAAASERSLADRLAAPLGAHVVTVFDGAYLAGAAFALAGSDLHHKICHVLGGALDAPHAETHAVLLPHVMAYVEPALPAAMATIRSALGADARGTTAARAAHDSAATWDGVRPGVTPLERAEATSAS